MNFCPLIEFSYPVRSDVRYKLSFFLSQLLKRKNLGDQCRIDLVVMTAVPLGEYNISFLQISSSLLYGFDLSWFSALCGPKCAGITMNGTETDRYAYYIAVIAFRSCRQ